MSLLVHPYISENRHFFVPILNEQFYEVEIRFNIGVLTSLLALIVIESP